MGEPRRELKRKVSDLADSPGERRSADPVLRDRVDGSASPWAHRGLVSVLATPREESTALGAGDLLHIGVMGLEPTFVDGLGVAARGHLFSVLPFAGTGSGPRGWDQALLGMLSRGDLVPVAVDMFPSVTVVALVADPDLESCVRLIRCGAAGIVDIMSAPEAIMRALALAVDGAMVVPAALGRAIVDRVRLPPNERLLDTDADWLRSLARGEALEDLARRVGYSTRQTQRRLADLYSRLGVGSKVEAVVLAARWGLLD